MTKKSEYINFEILKEKLTTIHDFKNFETILMTGNNGQKIPNESYANKQKKHVGFSYCYKLICVDDKFSKVFTSYLGEDA